MSGREPRVGDGAPRRSPRGLAILKSAVGAARFRLTGHRAPLAVTLVVTRRCDSSCAGCGLPMSARPELEPAELLDLLDHLAALGTTRLRFTGGEPLLRPDLGALVDRAAEHGIRTVLETNGHALPERVAELRRLDRVMVGLHGPEAVHDRVTEPGAFAKVIAGIRAAQAAGIKVGTVVVLGRHTVEGLPWLLEFAEQNDLEMVVQLAQAEGAVASRGAKRQLAADDEVRRALRWLLEARMAGRPVGMSEKTLRYLLSWEDYSVAARPVPHEDLHCMAGQVSCVVDADGGVYACLPRMDGQAGCNVRADGFDAAFARLPGTACQACTDTACTEANFLYNLNTPVVLEAARAGARTILGGAA